LDKLRAQADLSEVTLVGPAGVGRETLAARFAAERGKRLLSIDLPALVARGLDPREAILRALRHGRFAGELTYFRDSGAASEDSWTLASDLETPYLRGSNQTGSAGVAIALVPPNLGERLALWRRHTDAPAPASLHTHRLTPAELVRIAATPQRAGNGRPAARRPDHTLLSPMNCPYDWSDLVLPDDIERALRDFADQIRLRWSVYDDWGFSRLTHLGLGVAALFAGPSGTGKTMAAQVVARALNLDLYRVDLAGVVNKYVGETEKRLREVFDACEHSGSLLFFDEADALFGGRVQAKDAHDRFANIEINYLLQRIESFDGVTILATNRRNDIDQAFLRRLRFVVEFLPPRPEERLILWRKALHPRAPNGEDLLDAVNFELLAERLVMTGAEIKNTVLAAAFLAKARGERIAMGHLLSAAEREMTKQRMKLPLTLRDGAGR
jgi:SpoVK/Ycf46/Vps4 family AAA+-type ATPase